MKKITIIVLHLGYGGIEKAVSSFANMFCDDYNIEIISTYKILDKPVFDINKSVKIRYLISDTSNREDWMRSFKKLELWKCFIKGLKSLKILYTKKFKMIEAIKKCDSDIIISTRPFHNKLLGKYGKRDSLKIAWEHSHHNNKKSYINKVVKSCDGVDYLIPVSKELTDFYRDKVKCKCEYVPLSLDEFPSTTSKLNEKRIISVGRLSKEKGYLDLIEVFKLVNDKYPDWNLDIIGDGSERNSIEERIKSYNLKNIILHGYRDKKYINKLLEKSSIYVMASISESFGLVLLEAMSHGVPCVAFDTARGPLEIIDNCKNGFIIKNRNKEEMANAIIKLIEDEKLRKGYGSNSILKAKLFNVDTVKKEWLSILKN